MQKFLHNQGLLNWFCRFKYIRSMAWRFTSRMWVGL